MFRVYDNVTHKWCTDEFCISSYGDLYIVKSTVFGNDKVELVDDNRYIAHNYIDANDKYNNPIFEGDIVKHTGDDDISGIVAYHPEHAAYYVFDENNNAYYRLIGENRDEMQVVGNVFDGIITSNNSTDTYEDGGDNDSN